MVPRRGQEARDHQLPHPQAREGRPLLREDLRPHPGLGVRLRQVQARALQGDRLRALRSRGHSLQGASRAHGPHQARRAGHPHLVLQGRALAPGLPAQPRAQGPGEGHLLRGLHGHRGRRGGPSRRPALAAQRARGQEEAPRGVRPGRGRGPPAAPRGGPRPARGRGRRGLPARQAPQDRRARDHGYAPSQPASPGAHGQGMGPLREPQGR